MSDLPPVIPVAVYPNVPAAPGIPPMARPTSAINALLNGPDGVNAILADSSRVQGIIGGLSNAAALIGAVPLARQLLSLNVSAQMLLYRVPGLSLILHLPAAAQALMQTAQGLGSMLGFAQPVSRLVTGPATNAATSKDQPWGIFDSSNNQVVVPDSVIKFELLKDWKIIDYPIEGGVIEGQLTAFASYNKVEQPFTARMVLAKSGKLSDVTAFISALADAADSTSLYNVSTPQWVHKNVNITHIDWQQEATRGAYLLQVNVWMEQVRSAPTSTAPPANNTQQPSGQSPQIQAPVQAQPPTDSQAAGLRGPQ